MSDRDTAPQPPPIPTESEPIYKLVIAHIEAKAGDGLAKYGTYLQADNGRDHLTDAYQESIDQTKYLKVAIIERRALLDRIAALEAQLADAQARLAMLVSAAKVHLKEETSTYTSPGERAVRDAMDAAAPAVAEFVAGVERRGAAEYLKAWADEREAAINDPATLWDSDYSRDMAASFVTDLRRRADELEGNP